MARAAAALSALILVLGEAAAAGGRNLDAPEAWAAPGRELLAAEAKLRIVHFNDVNARFDPASTTCGPCGGDESVCFGGFARMATAVKQARAAAAANGSDVLVLHAGDQFQGTTWDYVYTRTGVQVAHEPLNAIGLDAYTLGNHDFDYGPTILGGFLGLLQAPALACNVDVSMEPALAGKVQPHVIKTLPSSGLKVAIVGLITNETADLSSPGPKVKFSPHYDALPTCVSNARAAGADVVILLTHTGSHSDLKHAEGAEAAGVDVIVSAHSHSLFGPKPMPPLLVTPSKVKETNVPIGEYPTNVTNTAGATEKSIPVVSALWASRYIGVLDTTWDAAKHTLTSATGAPVLLGGANSSNPVDPDAAMEAILAPRRAQVTAYASQVVGNTSVFLTGSRGEPGTPDAHLADPVREKETNLGNMICDALLWFIKTKTPYPSRPESKELPLVSIINGGAIRDSVPVGQVTRGDLVGVTPFGNYVVVKRVPWHAVLASLDNGLTTWSTKAPGGRFPQVGGMRYAFGNVSEDKTLGVSRVLLKDGRELGRDYTDDVLIATTDFIGVSPAGDGYALIGDAPMLLDSSLPVEDLLADYIKTFSPVAPVTEDRIVHCGLSPNDHMCRPEEQDQSHVKTTAATHKKRLRATAADGSTKWLNTDFPNAFDNDTSTFVLTRLARNPFIEVDLNNTVTLFAVAIYPAKLPANMTARKFPGAYTNDTTLTIRISPLPSKGRVLYKGAEARTCGTVRGPISEDSAAIFCQKVLNKLPEGRYLSVELARADKKSSRLAFSELQLLTQP